MSLCFYQAALQRKRNQISEEEFLDHIVAHCRGIRHDESKKCMDDEEPKKYFDKLHETDTFTTWIRDWALATKTVEDSTPLRNALLAYRANDVAALKAGLEQLDQAYGTDGAGTANARQFLCRYLSTVALVERKADILREILKEDFQFHWTFDANADAVKHDGSAPDIVKVIEESRYVSPVPPGKRFSDLHPLDYLM